MNTPIKILYAEDESSLAEIVKESLELKGFKVIHCKNGAEAVAAYNKNMPDILVLDVMMPKKDGFEVAADIRKTDVRTPIIFLTSKSETKDVVEGFEQGGNDYLKKPFSMVELIVRINALLNRNNVKKDLDQLPIGKYIFNYTRQLLVLNAQEILLTERESSLLFHLYEKKNNLLDRSFILKKLWGNDDFFNARSMDVFISKLRKRLQYDPQIKIINVRGFGYKLIC